MPAEANGTPANGAELAGPRITITFPAVGAADPSIIAPSVTPGQLYAAAFLLECVAREVRAGQVAQAAMAELPPGARELVAQLRRSGNV